MLAAVLIIVGAALAALGTVLTWATFPESVESFGVPGELDGFTRLAGESRDGPFFAVFAAILGAIGLLNLVARRVRPTLLVGIVLAGFGIVAAVIDLLDVVSPDGSVDDVFEPSLAPGLPIVAGGFAVAFVALIAAAIKRPSAPR
jgi:hypothetical protein